MLLCWPADNFGTSWPLAALIMRGNLTVSRSIVPGSKNVISSFALISFAILIQFLGAWLM